MDWPYHIVQLSTEEKLKRRDLIDRYGFYSQLSVIVPILVFWIYRLGVWIYHRFSRRSKAGYSAVELSEKDVHPTSTVRRWRSVRWWLGDEIAPGWGTWGHWIAGSSWAMWMLFLCVHRTGHDYLHLTKRFGVISMAQLPTHFLLGIKSPLSPLAAVFNTSYERLLPWHRLSGRLMFTFLLLHGTSYLNYFIQTGTLQEHLATTKVIVGIVAFVLLLAIIGTSIEAVRRRSYRVFTVTHSVAAFMIPALLIFHTKPTRWYIAETLVISALYHTGLRDSITTQAFIWRIPFTNLISVQILIPASQIQQFRAAPGQHVLLSFHPQRPQKKSVKQILFTHSPFSVADISGKDVITLIARVREGFTTRTLLALASSEELPCLLIFGPLGSSRWFPNLAKDYDRILLVAGGVGATFTLPIYRAIREQLKAEGRGVDRVSFVWSLKTIDEAVWAADLPDGLSSIQDEGIRIYLTQSYHMTSTEPFAGGSEVMEVMRSFRQVATPSTVSGRPDLGKIVDDLFQNHNPFERVAVLFCGPAEMGRNLRKHVGTWVRTGRDVWWHAEAFGW